MSIDDMRTEAYLTKAQAYLRNHPEVERNPLSRNIALALIRKHIDYIYLEGGLQKLGFWRAVRAHKKVDKEIAQILALPERQQRIFLVKEDKAQLEGPSLDDGTRATLEKRLRENEDWLRSDNLLHADRLQADRSRRTEATAKSETPRVLQVIAASMIGGVPRRLVRCNDGTWVETWTAEGWERGGATQDEFWRSPSVSPLLAAEWGIPSEDLPGQKFDVR